MWNSLGVTASTRGRLPLPRGDGFSLLVDADNPVSIDVWPHPSTWEPEEVLLIREGRTVAATSLGTDHHWVLTGADRFGTFRAVARSGEDSVKSAEFVILATPATHEPSGASAGRESRAEHVAALAAATADPREEPSMEVGPPSRGAAPPIRDVAPPTPAVAPPSPDVAPPTPSPAVRPAAPVVAPPSPAVAAPSPAVAPPAPAVGPPRTDTAPTPAPATEGERPPSVVSEPPPRVVTDHPPRVITDPPPRVVHDQPFPVADSPTPLAVPGTPSIRTQPAPPTPVPEPASSPSPAPKERADLRLPEGEYDARFAAWVGVLFALLSVGVLVYLTVWLTGDPGWPEAGQVPDAADGKDAAAAADVGTFADRVGLATSTLVIGIGAVLLFAGAALGALEVRARQRRHAVSATVAPGDSAALRLLPRILFQASQVRATAAVLFAGGIILTIGILGQLHWASQI